VAYCGAPLRYRGQRRLIYPEALTIECSSVTVMEETEAVVGHYESIREELRIADGFGQLELIRTREILHRHLPPPPCRVLDVGGGTGVHAEWLLDEGYQVHLVDITPRHVAIVQTELGAKGITAEVGDARTLTQGDGAFDVVLLLGPLYHLTARADRVRAFAEGARVARPGGVVVAAAISRFAALFDGLSRGLQIDSRFKQIVQRDLVDGQHRNPTNEPEWFTTAYFHQPDELRQEAEDGGLGVVALLGVEGLAGWLTSLAPAWSTADGREAILYAARATESEDSLRGLSSHMLIVTQVPG
jgi:SAM-dependent methyltransferase